MHSGMGGMYAMQESVRPCRASTGARCKYFTCLGVGGMLEAVVCFSSEPSF